MPFPIKTHPRSSCHQALGRKKLLIFPGSILSKICFPQQQKGVDYDLLYLNLVSKFRKYEKDLKHQNFCILYDLQFFKYDDFTVL